MAQAYGIVEPRRGRYREEDQLALVGTPFHVDVRPGTRVVTSGRGGVYPRGILLGTVVGIEDADTGWRKSYLVRPAVRPEAVTYVLVGWTSGGHADLSPLWTGTTVADAGPRRRAPVRDGLAVLALHRTLVVLHFFLQLTLGLGTRGRPTF
jgi:hypothetical protein